MINDVARSVLLV